MTGGAETERLYRLASANEWKAARATGAVAYSDIDRRDGYLHLSTARQVLGTARRHFSQKTDMLALEVDPAGATGAVKFERAPNASEVYPHLYGELPVSAVRRARRLLLTVDGDFAFGGDVE